MQLTPIENSSNVKAVGWEAGTLRVVYHDGKQYEAPCDVGAFGALMAAPSKGSHIHQHFRDTLRPAGELPEPTPKSPGSIITTTERPTSSSYEHDPCCGTTIQKALASGGLNICSEWTCPKCGEKWKPEIIGNAEAVSSAWTRHWTIRPHIEVLKLRG